ncbi:MULTISPECIES: hypothetical protein [unclassified Clostridium]|uniref:hypothetical protein n=1 Tax=unclassified Clostridium TaxID=2614128 RepID=UPI000297AB1E|nr:MULTISPECIES: hypothetical protein [unclassified Clostridium]EKQ52760.1 MAG: hypothetical protein A370_04065 [Clostridium sp. Maddingley MBC34-26]
MKQSSYSIGAQGRLRAAAGDHFIALPVKVKKSDISVLLDSNEVLKAGTLLTKGGKAVTTTANASDAYGVVYEDVSFKGAVSADGNTGSATAVVPIFLHGVLYEADVKFTEESTVAGGKEAERIALKQILFI